MTSAVDLLRQRYGEEPQKAQKAEEPQEAQPAYNVNVPEQYAQSFKSAEAAHGLPKGLLGAVGKIESNFNPEARSHAGAVGMMQIIPKWHPDTDPTNPEESIDYAGKYLKSLYDELGSWDKAVAAYNAGKGNIQNVDEENWPSETRSYLEKLRAMRIESGSPEQAKSAVDLLNQRYNKSDKSVVVEKESGKEEEEKEPEPEPYKDERKGKKEPYESSTVDVFSGGMWSPEIANKLGLQGIIAPPPGGFDAYGRPLDEMGEPINNVQPLPGAQETLKDRLKAGAKWLGEEALATGELAMNMASGMLLWLPSKAYGTMALPFGRDVAKMAEEEIASLGYQPHTEKGKAASELVGKGFEWFLTPSRNVDEEISKLSPEAGYVAGFGAELAQFAITGGLVKGAKAKFKPTLAKARKLFNRKNALERARFEKEVERIKSQVSDPEVQASLAEAAELKWVREQKEAQQRFNESFEDMVNNELAMKSEQIAKEKMRPIKEAVREKVEKKPVKKKKEKKVTKEKKKKEVKEEEVKKEEAKKEETKKEKKEEETEVAFSEAVTEDLALINELEKRYKKPIEEITEAEIERHFIKTGNKQALQQHREATEPRKVTEVDELTGEKVKTLEGENNPLFQTLEETKLKTEAFEGRKIDTVEAYTQKLINDVNRWYHKEIGVDINQVRKGLNDLVASADELRHNFPSEGNFTTWKSLVEEASDWAAKLDRSKSKQTSHLSDVGEMPEIKTTIDWNTQLNSMIPLNAMPKAVANVVKGAKKLKSLVRNKEVYNETGFWLGRDGKWRYELDASKAKLDGKRLESLWRNEKRAAYKQDYKISDVLEYSELYKVAPHLKETKLVIDKTVDASGYYDGATNTIVVGKSKPNLKFLLHELQHGVQTKLNRDFTPPSLRKAQRATLEKDILSIMNELKHKKSKEFIDSAFRKNKDDFAGFVQELNKALESGRISKKDANVIRKKMGDKSIFSEHRGELQYLMDMKKSREKLSRGTNLTESAAKAVESTIERGLKELESPELRATFSEHLRRHEKGADPELSIEAINHKLNKALENDYLSPKDVKTARDLKITNKNVLKQYFETPGEMEARVVEYRSHMNQQQRQSVAPWETLDRMIKGEKFTSKGAGSKLYSGPGEAAFNELVGLGKKVKNYASEARGLKKFKPHEAAREARDIFTRQFIERSGNIARELIKSHGDRGYRIVRKMRLVKGAPARSALLMRQLQKQVYGGLKRGEKQILDNIILAERMIDIAKYKSPKEFTFPEGLDPTSCVMYKNLLNHVEGISAKKAAQIKERAGHYFELMKKPIDDMLDAGLISPKEATDLKAHQYRKLETLDNIDPVTGKLKPSKISVSETGIKGLKKGRATDMFEPSGEVGALEVFNNAYNKIAQNKANVELLKLARNQPSNPFARIKWKGRSGPEGKIPQHWERVEVFEGGEKRNLYISPKMSKEWLTASGDMAPMTANMIRLFSGSSAVRLFATGVEWTFALANFPRDIAHMWFAARTFGGGKWRGNYSSFLPKAAAEMTADLASVAKDVALRKGRFIEYIEDGGGMELMTQQGRMFRRGKHVENAYDGVLRFLEYPGTTSELATRTMIRERVIKKRAKERGISVKEARKIPEIREEATFSARDYMDFSQGGATVKVVDNASPYLNAAVVGTRGLLRTMKDSPMEFGAKLGQLGLLTTGLYLWMKESHPETFRDIKDSEDMKSNFCIPLGDSFAFEDEKGQKRYPYLKIPADHTQRFFKKFFEASIDKMSGEEFDTGGVAESLYKMLSPLNTGSLPPSVSGPLGYVTNTDFWQNDDIWKEAGGKTYSWPRSKHEFTPGETPQAFIDIGEATGMSPERTKFLSDEFLTTNSMWMKGIFGAYEKAFGEYPKEDKQQHLAMAMSQAPGLSRYLSVTHPYIKHIEKIDEAEEKHLVKKVSQNGTLDMMAEGLLFEGNVTAREIQRWARSFKDPEVYERLMDRLEFHIEVKDLPDRSFWLRLKSLAPEPRAEAFVKAFEEADGEELERLRSGYKKVSELGGFASNKFLDEVMRLRMED